MESGLELLSPQASCLNACARRANVTGCSQEEEGWPLRSLEAPSPGPGLTDACDRRRGVSPRGGGVDMFVCSMGCAVSPSGTEGGIRPDWEGLASQISVYANSRAVTVGPAQCRVAGTRPSTLPCLSLHRSHVRWAWNRGGV